MANGITSMRLLRRRKTAESLQSVIRHHVLVARSLSDELRLAPLLLQSEGEHRLKANRDERGLPQSSPHHRTHHECSVVLYHHHSCPCPLHDGQHAHHVPHCRVLIVLRSCVMHLCPLNC